MEQTGNPEETQTQTFEVSVCHKRYWVFQQKKSKILTGFLQYYHLGEWAVSVTFIRKGEDLVFEFVKNVRKEGTDRSILQTIHRRLAQKKSSVNWSELILSTELRCTASFASESSLEHVFSKLSVSSGATGFTYSPLEVNLLVLVDPQGPMTPHLPPLEMWKKQEVTLPEDVFSFPYVTFTK